MYMIRYFLLLALLCFTNLLLSSCSQEATDPDSGIEDGLIEEDLDPCQANLPIWNSIWRTRTIETGLDEATPDNNLTDVWGFNQDDIYVVGFNGTILHYDGSQWTKMESGTTADLTGVWGYVLVDEQDQPIRTDVFAVGSQGTILRFDGQTWLPQLVINDPDPNNPDPQPVTDNFNDVWGISAAGINPDQHPTVFAVGSQGLIVTYDGTLNQFVEMRNPVPFTDSDGNTRISYRRWTPERLGGIFGTSASEFVTVGNNGTILEFDGNSWNRRVLTGFITHLQGVWGPSSGEVIAVGVDGTVVRRSGGEWQLVDYNLPAVYLRSFWKFSQSRCGDIPDGGIEPENTSWEFFIGWNGTVWLRHDNLACALEGITSNRLEGIWGTRPRSESDRTIPDAGVECDPIEVIITGVNGTLIRLSNPEGK
jgi:hypothetical protein